MLDILKRFQNLQHALQHSIMCNILYTKFLEPVACYADFHKQFQKSLLLKKIP